MAELKTKANNKSVKAFLEAVEHNKRRKDALTLLSLFEKITGQNAIMWGDSIVGFGRYHYKQRNGQAGEWPITGFSPRKQNLSIYIMPGFKNYQDLLGKLGKHKTSVSCLYINKLDDVNLDILEKLIATSIKDMKSLYNCD